MSELEGARPALDGVRVLDLARLLPGNYASLLLVGLGADVIKIEDLVGDGTRAAPPYAESGESGANIALNRGKASISLDLKQRDAQQLMLGLVAVSDVLLDSFRPGVLDRLGLGPAALAAANPRLVHVSLTAFGSGGPYQAVPAHDLNTEALAGIVGMSVDDSGRPALPAVPIADMATGLQAALAVVAGLRAVAADGAGYRAEVAMLDSALSLTALAAGHVAAGLGTVPAPRDMLTGALACYAYYRCADGGWQAVGALEPKFFQRTCELVGAPELAAMQYDLDRQDELRERLAAIFATRSRDEWSEVLLLEDTCVTPVNDLAEAFADANVSAREVVVDAARSDGSPARVVRAVPWLPEVPGQSPAPLGGDAAQVLRELLGTTADELADLQERGCVGGSS